MINDTQTRLSDEVVEPLLLDILSDRELNSIIQKCSSSDKVEIGTKISQNGQQLHLIKNIKFTKCPCQPPQHNRPCSHDLDVNGNPIC